MHYGGKIVHNFIIKCWLGVILLYDLISHWHLLIHNCLMITNLLGNFNIKLILFKHTKCQWYVIVETSRWMIPRFFLLLLWITYLICLLNSNVVNWGHLLYTNRVINEVLIELLNTLIIEIVFERVRHYSIITLILYTIQLV